MSEPNWLVNFPPDILTYVVCYLPGEQLWRLKMTGCTLLWRKLTLPRVVKSVTLGNDFFQIKTPPSFLNEFPSLEELAITSKYREWWSSYGLKADSVPSTLRKLELTGIAKFWDFFVDKEGGDLNPAEYLPHLESLRISGAVPSNYRLTQFPKSLTNLAIDNWTGTMGLPPSLTRLEAYHMDFRKSLPDFEFPPGLETLQNDGIYDLDLLIPLIPSSLCKVLSASMFKSSHFCAEHFPTRSMTTLRLPSTDFDSHMISLLPPSLTDFEAGELPHSLWSSLPTKLQKLAFVLDSTAMEPVKTVTLPTGEPCEFHTLPIDHLPRSITDLKFGEDLDDLHFWRPSTESNIGVASYFPPNLTGLEVISIYLTPEIAKLLPSSLTKVDIPNLCEQVCEHLTNRVTELTADFTLVTPNLIKFLPKSLTYLHLSCLSPKDPWYDYNTGESIDLKQIGIITDEENECFYSLPSSITHLELDSLSDIGDSFMMNQKLPYLDQLHVNCGNFSDLSIPLLSVHLTVLCLSSSSRISGKSFPFLPKGLTVLNLNSSELIFDSDIQHLPKTLERLYINSAIHLSEQCIPDLPQRLEYLIIQKNDKITPACHPHLPYPLRSLQYYQNVILARWCINFGKLLSR